MIIQNSFKKILREVGDKYSLTEQEAIDHYMLYIDEFIIKSLYEADFDVLKLNGLGNITPGLLACKSFLRSLKVVDTDVKIEIKNKLSNMVGLVDNLNLTLKKKKLYK
jgi:hypothetical protein